jgi:hypothetical protein
MKSIMPPRLLALALGAWLASFMGPSLAASGYSVTEREAQQITAGMSPEEVRRLIGRPAHDVQYRNEPGPLWSYTVSGMIDPTLFEIGFSADGKVLATRIYQDPTAYQDR